MSEVRAQYGKPSIKAVEIEAELRQVKTMVDGSVNIILNVPGYCMPQIKVIMDWLGEQVKVMLAND